MSHGQFYKADELVELIHHNFGGFHPGARAVHANGRIHAGTFTATVEAKSVSRAAHFQGTPIPVTSRFSGGSGDPGASAGGTIAMASRFYLPDGTVTDLIAINLPAFPARIPDDIIGLLSVAQPDPTTGKPDLAKVQAFLADHPAAGRVVQLLQVRPAPVSFAQVSYRPLHAFRFVNAAGEGCWALSLGAGGWQCRSVGRGNVATTARFPIHRARESFAAGSGGIQARPPTRAGGRSGGRPFGVLA